MVLVTAKKEDSSERVLARAKSNISVDTGGFSYTIEGTTVKDNIETTVCRWGDGVEGSAHKIISSVEDSDFEHGQSALEEAKDRLVDTLQAGPKSFKEIEAEAKAAGHSIATIQRAKKALKIKPFKSGMGGGWIWALPE